MKENSFNRIQVSRSALQHNYRLLSRRVGPNVPVLAMVKADAYGHGMIGAARAFTEAGCKHFGVAELREAIVLREAGVDGEIFVTIGFAPEEAELLLQYRLTPVVYSLAAVQYLAEAARRLGLTVDAHLKVDTGMGRLGVYPDDVDGFLQQVAAVPEVRIVGLMSHFPEADSVGAKSSDTGLARFEAACSHLNAGSLQKCHIANSGAVLNLPDAHFDMVRGGIALYGYHPAGAQPVDENVPEEEQLRPAMRFVSRVLQVKDVAPGTGISYGHTFSTERQSKIAVIPVGYEDGFSRRFSNTGEVLVCGHRAPVRGRVCMNMCMIDVTDIEGVEPGDEVVLLGSQGEQTITADELAAKVETISYELLCLLGNNNKREYIE